MLKSAAHRIALGIFVIALAIIAAYMPSLRGGFIFDDDVLLTKNRLVHAPDGLYRIWFTTEPLDYWPVTNTTFWIEWRLWGLDPLGYHVVNLLLHFGSALLIWAILRKLTIPGAFLAALLFAVHPLNVESVAWISQRKTVLSLFFFLVSIWYFLKTDDASASEIKVHGQAGSRVNYWMSLLAFVVAMLSKGSVAILPVVLLLLEWWKRGAITRDSVRRILPFFYIAGALTVVNIWFQTHLATEPIRTVTLAQRLLGAGQAIWFYLGKALLPIDLLFIYPKWELRTSDVLEWTPLLAAIAVTIVLWRLSSRGWGRSLLFAWAFFVVALLPILGLVDVYFMKYSLVADHYVYIALIAVTALTAAGFASWEWHSGRAVQLVAYSLPVVLVLVLIWGSNSQAVLYQDAKTLYVATLAKNPNCWVLHYNLGNSLDGQGHLDEAISHYQETVRLKPDYAEAHNNLACDFSDLGRTSEAIDEFREVLKLKPPWIANVHYGLAIALAKAGRDTDAVDEYQLAVDLKPNQPEIQFNFANALLKVGRIQEAIDHYSKAVKLKPDLVEARCKLGDALAQQGRLADAAEQFQQALRYKMATAAEVHAALAGIQSQLGQTQEAIRNYQEAIQLRPNFPAAYYNLANTLVRAGLAPASVEHYRQAIRLKPDFAEASNGLGAALLSLDRLDEAIKALQNAVAIKPNYPEAYANLAEAYRRAGEQTKAVEVAQEALKLAKSQGQASLATQIEAWLAKNREH